jgi:hypothetical protein
MRQNKTKRKNYFRFFCLFYGFLLQLLYLITVGIKYARLFLRTLVFLFSTTVSATLFLRQRDVTDVSPETSTTLDKNCFKVGS